MDDNGVILRKGISQKTTCCNYWFLSRLASSCSCRIMHLCLAVIWAEIGHWPDWRIAFIGLVCQMMSKHGLDNVLFVSNENFRPDATTPWGTYQLVIDGIVSLWISWMCVTQLRTDIDTCADTATDLLVEKIILRFGMPLAIHREFENLDSWNHCVLYWDVLRQRRPLTSLSQMAWLNSSIEHVSWCCPCSSTTGVIIVTTVCHAHLKN